MGIESAVVLGLGAVKAISSISAGNQQAKAITQAGEYNAQVYEQQAGMIQQQKQLADYQSRRKIAFARGHNISHTAGSGLEFSGSPVAVTVDSESQMLLDQAVNDYNYDVESQKARSAAQYSRSSAASQASSAKSSGFSGAFSSILNTGASLFGAGNL